MGVEKTINAVAARRNFGQMLEEAYHRGNRFIVERAGRPMAVVVPIEQYEQWQYRREQFFSLIDQVQQRTRQVPVAELEEVITEAVVAAKQGEPS